MRSVVFLRLPEGLTQAELDVTDDAKLGWRPVVAQAVRAWVAANRRELRGSVDVMTLEGPWFWQVLL